LKSEEATMDDDCCDEVDAKPCLAKLSCEICALMRYYTAQTDNSLTTFWEKPTAPSLRNKKSKSENRA
jgi:hypothetical protein